MSKPSLKISDKLLLFSLLIVAIVAVGGIYSTTKMNNAYRDIYEAMGLTLMCEELSKDSNNFHALTYAYLLIENPSEAEIFMPKWEKSFGQLNHSLEIGRAHV
jgi:hypothetical protein